MAPDLRFDTDDPEFQRGFEIGVLWERLVTDGACHMAVSCLQRGDGDPGGPGLRMRVLRTGDRGRSDLGRAAPGQRVAAPAGTDRPPLDRVGATGHDRGRTRGRSGRPADGGRSGARRRRCPTRCARWSMTWSRWSPPSGAGVPSTSTTRSTRWPGGTPPGAATARRHAPWPPYLAEPWGARMVLVGEAPGQNGARVDRGAVHVAPPADRHRTQGADRHRGAPGAVRAGAGSDVLLWKLGAVPTGQPRSPEGRARRLCRGARARCAVGREVLAVGRHAQRATGAPYVRHPSHGGAARVRRGLRRALR